LLDLVTQINSFIHKPFPKSIKIQRNEKELVYTSFGMTVFASLITLLTLAIAPYVNLSADLESNLLTLERRNLFCKRADDYQIADIAAVKVDETSDIESTQYRVVIRLKSGNEVPLTYCFTSGGPEKYAIAHKLQKFLQREGRVN
jgi:hypothetical protein